MSQLNYKFIVEEYSLQVLFDNGISFDLGTGCFESDISHNNSCSKISTSITIQDFVNQFTNSSINELANTRLEYMWINSNGNSGFSVTDGHFHFSGGHMEHGEFIFKIPITE